LNALFNELKGSIIGRLDGGLIPGSSGLSGMTSFGQKFLTINENSKPEYVINAKSTKKYKTLLDMINEDRMPLHLNKNIDSLSSNNYINTDGIENKLDKVVDRLDRVERAQLSIYNRSAVQVEMSPLQAKGTDFYSAMKSIKKRSLKG
jgi:hypothetical protein